MSMRYLGESLAILKAIDSPMLTLMSVANPWMRGSPEPLMSHSVDGFPGLQFSATTLLAGFVQAPAPCGARCAVPGADASATTNPAPAAAHSVVTRRRRCPAMVRNHRLMGHARRADGRVRHRE